MKAVELLQESKKELKKVSFNPYQESLWILAEVLNLSTSDIYLGKEDIDKNQKQLFFDKIYKRKQGQPLEYILREKFFFKKKFYIEEGVFIPRQETETLIYWVLNNIQETELKAVDFGAGSGSLCLTLLSSFPKSKFIALEISSKSIECLKKNSRLFEVEERLHVLQRDVYLARKKELVQFLGTLPSLIVANPPYIDPWDRSISREAYFFDPPLALFSDRGGMGHIFSWFKKAMNFLSSNGIYIFEFGWNQSDEVRKFCNEQKALKAYEIHKDLSGIPRIAVCFKS